MKKRIKRFGKPQKGICFFSTGNITEDLQKYDELKAKSELQLGKFIERNAAINFVKKYTPNIDGETTMQCVETALENVPSANVHEVKQGRWLYGETDNPFIVEIYCPWCGKPALYHEEDDRPVETDFCPHCGAIMDAPRADPSWPFFKCSLKRSKQQTENQTTGKKPTLPEYDE